MKYLLLVGLIFLSNLTFSQSVTFNEVQSSNLRGFTDEDGDADDWIELYNNSSSPVNLNGFTITDDLLNPFKWQFPNITIQPQDFLILFCDEKDRTSIPLHTNFAIGKNGETVYLFNTGGSLVDSLAVPALREGVSYGKQPDGTGQLFYFDSPSADTSNTSQAFNGWLTPPSFGLADGIYTSSQTTTIEHDSNGVSIFYEFGPQIPNTSSLQYSVPLTLDAQNSTPDNYATIPTNPGLNFPFGSYSEERANTRGWVTPFSNSRKNTVITAIASKAGYITSEASTASYLINNAGNPFGLPIISITSNPDGIFSDSTGIYVYGNHPDGNYRQRGLDWERVGNLNYILEDGTLAYSRQIGLRTHGGGGRHSALKTLRVYARSEYGDNMLNYPFFGEGNGDRFRRLLVRGPGHRPDCILRDDLASVITANIPLDNSHVQHVAFFLNGEYWGIFSLKERLDEEQLELNYGFQEEELVILEGKGTDRDDVYHGEPSDTADWLDMITYLDTADMTSETAFNYANERIDIENLIDYNAVQTYFSNGDWPNNNIRYWKKRITPSPSLPPGNDGRWRYLFFDLDAAFGGDCTGFFPGSTGLARALSTAPEFRDYNVLFRNLIQNDSFRVAFINRCADLANTTFLPARLDTLIDRYTDLLDPNMLEYAARWRYPSDQTLLASRYNEVPSVGPWEDIKDGFKVFTEGRPRLYRRHIIDELNVSDTSNITLDVNDYLMGEIGINTIRINPQTDGVEGPNPYPWTGVYFHDVQITAYARPKAGYRFVRWEGSNLTSDTLRFAITQDTLLTAIFEPTDVPFSDSIFVNEIMPANVSTIADEFGDFDDWVELYNPYSLAVDVSGYYVSDDPFNPIKYRLPQSEQLLVPANGYLLLWADDEPSQGATHLPFKLSSSGEFFGLYRPNETVVDDEFFPAVAPDVSYARNGDGADLWIPFTPTPNAANLVSGSNENQLTVSRSIFPNPSTGIVRFNLPGTGRLIDLSGRTLLEFNNSYGINASIFPQGTYILIFEDGDRKRIVLTK